MYMNRMKLTSFTNTFKELRGEKNAENHNKRKLIFYSCGINNSILLFIEDLT